MKYDIKRVIASFAIVGLVAFWSSPIMASNEYDPNDPNYDPSGTYVPEQNENINSNSANSNSSDNSSTTSSNNPDNGNSNTANANSNSGNENSNLSDAQNSNSNQNVSDPKASNEITGANSNNSATVENSNSSESNVNNNSNIGNQTDASANTGENKANENTGNGEVETGNSDLVANIVEAANTIVDNAQSMAMPVINMFSDLVGDLTFDAASSGGGSFIPNLFDIASNRFTGSNSSNNAEVKNSNEVENRLNNIANSFNDLVLDSNTGNNEASYNTGNGGIETGDAEAVANVVNFLNNSITAQNWWLGMVNIFGDWFGNLILPNLGNYGAAPIDGSSLAGNSLTGFNSENDSILKKTTSAETTLLNQANLVDRINLDASTGDNEASYNTGGGSVKTGDVYTKSNEVTYANNTVVGDSWWMMLVNTIKGWTGAIIGSPDGSVQFIPVEDVTAENEITGANSENNAVAEDSSESEASIINQADLSNQLSISANTGGNRANYNTGSGKIKTGDANVISNLINFVNNTFNVKNWMLGIVNVFGNWVGDAKMGSTALGVNQSVSRENITVLNEGTGFNSENNATIESDNNNLLDITNRLNFRSLNNILANTGRNEANFNTCDAFIDTGDIEYNGDFRMIGNGLILPEELFQAGIASIEAVNDGTGARSENDVIVTLKNGLRILVGNTADFAKQFAIDLNTGENEAEENTGDAIITTGSIRSNFNEIEKLNFLEIIPQRQPVVPPEENQVSANEVFVAPNLASLLGATLPEAGPAENIVYIIFGGVLMAIAAVLRKRS